MVQNIESRLVKAIKRQAEKVVYYCSAENVSRDLAIHEIRKSFKRIRALLKFYPLTSDDSSQDYSAKISILARELSTARESFMNIRILEKITAKKQFIPEKSLENLKLQLTEKNKVLVKELLEGKRIFLEIQSLIYDIEGRLYDMILHSPVKIDIAGQIRISFEKSYNLFNEVINTDYNPVMYHLLRKKMKVLWYQVDFEKYRQPRIFKLKSNELRKITDLLGDDHDSYVFQTELNSEAYGLNQEEREILIRELNRLKHLRLNRINTRLRKCFEESPEEFGETLHSLYKVSQS